MSVIKFELKENHINLLKHLEWNELTESKDIVTKGENTPFGGFDHYEDMGPILYGQPADFDPFEGNPFEWTDEQKEEMDELLAELPMALEIILNTQSFKPGNYKTKFHDRHWKQLNK